VDVLRRMDRVLAERLELVPLNPLGAAVGPTRPGVDYPASKLLFIPVTYAIAWLLADYAVLRLRRAQSALREALRVVSELARTDGLTKLWNRRYLEERLEAELDRADRHERIVSVLMLDLDHFKAINDDHGHAEGDATLIRFAELVRKCVRKIDIVARYGGEEFVVVLPETKPEAARAIAERIRAMQRDQGLHTTVSIGIASTVDHGTNPADLIAAADRALYRAKNAGRDRVDVAA
jgi:diguanylate cyclase (GGDEF)-like protein